MVAHDPTHEAASGAGRGLDRHPDRSLTTLCLLVVALVFPNVRAAAEEQTDLVQLSLEELLNVEVTSVSKKKEKRQEAAAAIYVLTEDDIRRSAARTIPDLLRTVPGINVAQLNANIWSVTARGFAGRFANKLLVLIDGRSVYTPLFSGIYWEGQDVMLEDVERIEIIRGPGGTLWGANAVNGVINIVTKEAEDTRGLLITGGGGTEERGFAGARWGGAIGDTAYYRLYTKYVRRDESGETRTGLEANDAWELLQGGFRLDWDVSSNDRLTLQGDMNDVDLEEMINLAFVTPPFVRSTEGFAEYTSHNLLGRWTHTLANDSELQLQAYYDYYSRADVTQDEDRRTFDIQFQHRLTPQARHELVWGAGFRYTKDDIRNSEFVILDPNSRSDELYNAFIQDDIALTDELHLILGSKFEHNGYTGFEVQPNVRMRWSPNERHTLWAAVSRAVRTPSRAEDDVRLRSTVTAGPNEFILVGRRDFEAEDLLAFEFGYRVQPRENLVLDFAAFYNLYNHHRSLEPETPFMATNPDRTVLPFSARNDADARTYGFEITADWTPRPRWRVRAAYSFLEVDLDPPANDPISETFQDNAPEQQFFVQNRFNLPHNIEFDATLRYVDTITAGALPTVAIDDYLELDARLAWRPRENLTLEVAGRNLLNDDHFEFAPTFVSNVATQVERGVYGKLTWEFKPGGSK